MQKNAKNLVDFGSQRLKASDKQARVRELFDRVAKKYDLMNDLMSLGLHRVWKREMILKIAPQKHEILWDVAGGSGDVAFRFLKAGGGKATITDISSKMLQIGYKKALAKGLRNKSLFIQDDMENSKLESRQFHCAVCAWGLRNATSPALALQEIYRCLRFGGRFFAIEFAPSPELEIAPLYQFWCSKVVPHLGAKIANDAESYRYLVESIRKFQTPLELQKNIGNAGFKNHSHMLLAGGIAALHCGWKL